MQVRRRGAGWTRRPRACGGSTSPSWRRRAQRSGGGFAAWCVRLWFFWGGGGSICWWHSGTTPALDRALGLWHKQPGLFRELVAQGMAWDYSWNHPGQRYLDVYEFIRHK